MPTLMTPKELADFLTTTCTFDIPDLDPHTLSLKYCPASKRFRDPKGRFVSPRVALIGHAIKQALERFESRIAQELTSTRNMSLDNYNSSTYDIPPLRQVEFTPKHRRSYVRSTDGKTVAIRYTNPSHEEIRYV